MRIPCFVVSNQIAIMQSLLVHALDIDVIKSTRTASSEFYLEIGVYIGLISYGLLKVLQKYRVSQNK